MSRTFVHTPPEYVFETDERGFVDVPRHKWYDAGRYFSAYKGERLGCKERNSRIRRDRAYMDDFDNYVMPKVKRGWWD